jgi:Na+-translocating ferredoxin:NAD+ oxidoreductase RnfC subunit
METTGASQSVIAVKRKYSEACEALENVLDPSGAVRLEYLENYYPAGDEFELVRNITGVSIPEGGIPLDVGAVVSNINTVLNIFNAVINKKAVSSRWVTVAGELENPFIAEVPVGISAGELVDIAVPKNKGHVIMAGGPMMGSIVERDFPISKLCGGVLVLPSDIPAVSKKMMSDAAKKRRAKSVCDQCFDCSLLCPRNLLGHNLEPHKMMRNLFIEPEKAQTYYPTNSLLCCECGICDMYACPLDLSPRSMLIEAKKRFRSQETPAPALNRAPQPHPERDFRRVSTDRLMGRLGVASYDLHSPELRKVETGYVRIAVKQHIGVPAAAVVKKGDKVAKGQLIAAPPGSSLGANIHSSITGVVEETEGEYIAVRAT